MAVASIFTELDIDLSKFKSKQETILKDIELIGSKADKALQYSFQKLGVTADQTYQMMANLAIKAYEKISASANASAAEQYRAQASMVAKINALNQQMAASPGLSMLGIRSTEQLNQERLAIMEVYKMERAAAAGNARDIEAIEVATTAKLTALDNEYMAVKIANDAKAVASAKNAANEIIAAQEKIRAQGLMQLEASAMRAKETKTLQEAQAQGIMTEMEWQKKMEATKSEAWAENAKRTREQGLMQIQATKDDVERTKKATSDKIAATNEHYNTLGMKSAADVKQRISDVQNAATAQQAIVGKSSDDWVRIERAKNEKLKELNREMTGQHEMSMASMTRAVLRFYAAYYVISTVVGVVGRAFMSGVETIDKMQLSAVTVAATITNLQGTTGNIAENYKNNLGYAKALVPVLMQIDAASLMNLEQVNNMNNALAMHGVILDGSNKKQVVAATALSNAIAMYTAGQSKEQQSSQETNALLDGTVSTRNKIAKMVDTQIRRQGDYKDGLAGLNIEAAKHNDWLERISPYLVGIAAASGDIQKTWEATSSSLKTTWMILQTEIFADFYKGLVTSGQELVGWARENAPLIGVYFRASISAIADAIGAVWGVLKGFGPLLKDIPPLVSAIAYGWGGVLAVLKPIGEFLGNSISLTYNLLKMIGNATLAIGAFATGNTSVAKTAWEEAKKNFSEVEKLSIANRKILVDGIADAIVGYDKQYQAAKKAAGSGYVPGVSPGKGDEAALKKAEDIQKQITEIIRKNQLEREKIGKSVYEQDLLTIESEKQAHITAGWSVSQAEKAAIPERQTAVAKFNEWNKQEENKATIANYDAQKKKWDEIGKLAVATNKKEFEEQKKSFEAYQRMMDANEDLALSDHQRAMNRINAKAKAEQALIDLQVLSGKISPAQAELDKTKIAGITGQQTAEELAKDASDVAKQYANLTKYADTYYTKKMDLIEKTRQMEIGALMDVGAANAKAAQEQLKLIGEVWDLKHKEQNDVIAGTGKVLDAAMTMYDTDSSEYKRLADLKKGILIAEMAMEAAKNVALLANMIAQNAAYGAAMAKKVASLELTAAEAILTQGEGEPYTAFARIAAMMAIVAGVLGAVGVAGGFGSSSSAGSTANTETYTGTSTVLGASDQTGSESISRSYELLKDTYDMEDTKLTGIYNEMKDLNTNITGLVTGIVKMGLTTFGAAAETNLEGSAAKFFDDNFVSDAATQIFGNTIAKIVDPVFSYLSDLSMSGFGSIANWFAGGDSTTTSTGSGISFGAGKAGSQTFSGYRDMKTETDKGWLFGGGTDTTTWQEGIALSAEVNKLLTKVFTGMGDTLVSLAGELGTSTTDALNYTFEAATLSLQGMTTDEMNTAISEYFSNLADTAVEALFGDILSQYQELDEGLLETAVRIVSDKNAILNALDMTNQAFSGTTVELIAFSESLITLAGDLDTLTTAVSSYYDKFFSDGEKYTYLLSSLTDVFASMDVTMPATREAYKALVESLDLTTEAGQSTYVSMMLLADTADSFYTMLDDMVSAISDAKDSMELEGLTYAESQATTAYLALKTVLAEAKLGNFTNVSDLDLSTIASNASSTSGFATREEYQANYWKTYNSLTQLEDLVGGTTTTEEKSLVVQTSSLSVLQEIAANTSTTTATTTSATTAATIASDTAAAAATTISDTAATTSTVATSKVSESWTVAALTELYYKVFYPNGFPLGTLLPNSDTMIESLRVQGYASGGDFSGGWRVVGEQGPELEYTQPSTIISNSGSKAFLDNSDMVAAINDLKEELKTIGYAVSKNTLKATKIFDRWDQDGLPPDRAGIVSKWDTEGLPATRA
jgi:hypothetical protein